jgi:hypothetical protein
MDPKGCGVCTTRHTLGRSPRVPGPACIATWDNAELVLQCRRRPGVNEAGVELEQGLANEGAGQQRILGGLKCICWAQRVRELAAHAVSGRWQCSGCEVWSDVAPVVFWVSRKPTAVTCIGLKRRGRTESSL